VKRDLREDSAYLATREFILSIYGQSFGKLASVEDLRVSNDGRWIALSGPSLDDLTSLTRSRIALYDVADGTIAMLDSARNDLCPRWSPTNIVLAFLSDRARGLFAPYLFDPKDARIHELPRVPGSAESLAWSPDGTRLVVQTAQPGAERAGSQGSGIVSEDGEMPDWVPEVEATAAEHRGRSLWICSSDGSSCAPIGPPEMNVWESQWCGNDAIVAVVSDNPSEAAWFEARLVYIDVSTGRCETIYRPKYQIGLPVATRAGRYVAAVEGLCSDRGLVTGDVLLFDRTEEWRYRHIDSHGVDVTSLSARDAAHLSFAGIRDFEVVAGEIDAANGIARPVVSSSGSWLRSVPGVAAAGPHDYVTVAHSYAQAPALVRYDAKSGDKVVLQTLTQQTATGAIEKAGNCARRTWKAADGLEIHGYFVQPASTAPHPLVVLIHGGPVWAYTNSWRLSAPLAALLADRGYAVFLPNPRGSAGRGQGFVRKIVGDIGGGEADDIVSGVDSLIQDGLADPERIAVVGASHGGYLAAWLVTQSNRFAAAVAAFPICDFFSGYLTGTPSEALPCFIESDPFDRSGRCFTRSPVMHAQKARTPTLLVAGAHDRCTGVTQALEFHRALIHYGVESELVTYPLEGHGIRNIEASIDYLTRVLYWLASHGCRKREAPSRASLSSSFL